MELILRRSGLFIAGMITAVLIAVATIQPAVAASVVYVNDVDTVNNQWRSSSVAQTISGGEAGVIGLGIGTVHLQTYLAYPGFSVYASADGGSPGLVYLNHQRVSSYLSRCMWTLPVSGTSDPMPLYCAYDQ